MAKQPFKNPSEPSLMMYGFFFQWVYLLFHFFFLQHVQNIGWQIFLIQCFASSEPALQLLCWVVKKKLVLIIMWSSVSKVRLKCCEIHSREMACVHAHYPLTHDSMKFALFSKKKKRKEGEGSKKQTGWPLLKISVQQMLLALQIEGFSSLFLLILFCFCTYFFNKPCV